MCFEDTFVPEVLLLGSMDGSRKRVTHVSYVWHTLPDIILPLLSPLAMLRYPHPVMHRHLFPLSHPVISVASTYTVRAWDNALKSQ